MKKLTAATLNMILALGVICILAGVLFFTRVAGQHGGHVEAWTVILTASGAVIFYLSLVKFNYAQLFFAGLYFVLTGFFFLIVCSGLVHPGFRGLWPVSIVLAGLCTLFTGIAKDRRIRTAYLFPSVLLMGMGSYFLLFSLDIVSMSFRRALSIFWPVFPVVLGLSLIVLFLIQQNPSAHFPYDSEESEGEGEVRE